MRPARERRAALALALLTPAVAWAEPAHDAGHGDAAGLGLFDGGDLGNRKEPITVTSDTLEYDYKNNVVVYRGDVLAVQGTVKVRSDTLTVTFEQADPAAPKTPASPGTPPAPKTAPAADDASSHKLHDIVAVGSVRIDHGTRWATGGHAVFDQSKRTVVLTEDPVMHDGSNEVAGDRVVVFLDEDRSVVEGGRKRVKAVLYPGKDGGLAPVEAKSPPADARTPPESAGATAEAASP